MTPTPALKSATAELKSLTGTVDQAGLKLLAQVIQGYHKNRQGSFGHTLTRADVRGGGRKPWRQKGTGRARTGSIRGPQWRTGGSVFGPRKDRDHSLGLPRGMRTKALTLALADRATHEAVFVVTELPADGRTKSLATLLGPERLATSHILLVLETPAAILSRAARNLPRLEVRLASQVTADDVLGADAVVGTSPALKALVARTSTKITKETV